MQSRRPMPPFKILLALALAMPACAAIQAGVARADITPKESIWLAGFAARTHRSEGVRQHLFAKALALRDDSGSTVVLETSALLGFTAAIPGNIGSRVEKQFGVTRDRI